MKKAAAFSLIELMLILAVVAILVALGIPKISNVTQSTRITEVTNKLSSYLAYARSEAVTSSRPVGIIPAGPGGDWMTGWTVFADINTNGALDPGETLKVVGNQNIPNVTLTGPAVTFFYTQTGRPRAAGAFAVRDTRTVKPLNGRNITVSPIGRTQIDTYYP